MGQRANDVAGVIMLIMGPFGILLTWIFVAVLMIKAISVVWASI